MKILRNFLIITSLILSSCGNLNLFTSKVSSENFEHIDRNYQHRLAPDDKISLSVWNHDDISIGSSYSIYNTNESFGKWILVEKDSTVKIPKIGTLKLGGLTLPEAEQIIMDTLSTTIQQPLVEIKVLNAEITILGEVNQPGTYLIEKELNTLTDLIGKCQGLTSFAKKSKIQIIRNNESIYVDLTSMEQYQNGNIYLKAGDIINVPSVKTKLIHERAPTIIPFATLMTSVGILISVLAK